MRTTILAYLIAFVGLVMIAAGVWDFSNLEAETGETLALSDYAPAVQTIAEGLGSLLIKSTIPALRRGRLRPGNFARACRSGLRCAGNPSIC